MASRVDFTILQLLQFDRSLDVLYMLTSLNLPCQVYASALATFLFRSVDFNWQNVSLGVNPDGKQT